MEEAIQVNFLLFDNFSLLSFSSAIEPLRIANKVLGRQKFEYSTLSLNSSRVRASNGLYMESCGSLFDAAAPDLIVICSSDGVEKLELPAATGPALKRLERHGTQLAAICTGSYLLAHLRLLEGRRCTIHWEYDAAFREQFPDVQLCNSVVVECNGLLTCSGGTAPLDMMMSFVASRTSVEVARQTADIAIHHSLRDQTVSQRLELRARLDVPVPKLLECIGLMEGNIETPIDVNSIAGTLNLSRRQVERYFKDYLDTSPSSYYQQLRLKRAYDLLTKTTMSAEQVAMATGFNSTGHFSSVYKRQYGVSPFQNRRKRK